MDCPVKIFPHLSTLESCKRVEFQNPVPGSITGEIPHWLNGDWYRNGPGILHFRDESVKHWFDGMALVRKFSIRDGNVFYTSRLLAGESLKKNVAAGKLTVAEFGTPPQSANKGLLRRLKSIITLPELTDNCVINFLALGDHLLAITESNFAQKIDPSTLETETKVDLAKNLPINLMASHPIMDSSDGSVYVFSSSIFSMGRTKYNLIKFPRSDSGDSLEAILERAFCVASLDSTWRISPSYHHSFSVSENYAVFVEMPFKMDIPKMAVAHLRHMSYSKCLELIPDTMTKIFLINKNTGKQYPITYKTDSLIAYHHINAYEEDDHLILDLCCYRQEGYYDKFLIENLEDGPKVYGQKFSSEDVIVRARRFILPLLDSVDSSSSGNLVKLTDTTCTAEVVKDDCILCCGEELICGTEIPVINEKFRGKKYRYFYSPGGQTYVPGDMLAKIDVTTKSRVLTWKEEGCWTSEPVFVPTPEASSEDDGLLLSCVNQEEGKPFLLILDAANFKEVARVHFEANIPPDLHGVFIPRS